MTPGINRDGWLQAVRDVETAPAPPSDALTIREFAALLGVTYNQADRRMRSLMDAGKAERARKLIRHADGGLRPVAAYRLKA